MKKNQSKATANKMFLIITALNIVLYLVCYLTNFAPGKAILGIPLMLYIPGALLINLLPPLKFYTGKIGQFSLSAIYSLSALGIIGFISQTAWGFNTDYQVILNIALSALIWFGNAILPRFRFWQNLFGKLKSATNNYQIAWYDYIALSIFFLAILIIIILNPLAQNYDNYLVILKLSIFQDVNLLGMRHMFNSVIGSMNKFTDINIIWIYRYFCNILFFISTLIFYDLLKRSIKNIFLQIMCYLLLVSAPVILIQLNYTMPQLVLLTFTLPTLILLIDSLRKKNILASITALALSLIAIQYHQLSGVLLVISLTVICIHLYDLTFVAKKIKFIHIILFILIVAPYFIFFKLYYPLVVTAKVITFGLQFFTHFQWRWWFLSGYKDIDGINVGFTGINAIYYYLYNGILPLILLIWLFVSTVKRHIKIPAYFLPPLMYFAVFFAVAEITPRFGFIFLPSRAWLHMMLAVVLLIALFASIVKKTKNQTLLVTIMALTIFIGYIGTIYLTAKNIKKVYVGEMPVANYIKNNLPSDALVISSQDNNAIVYLYGDHYYFGRILPGGKIDRSTFDSLVNKSIDELKINANMEVQDKINRYFSVPPFDENNVYFLYCYSQLGAINNSNTDRTVFNDITNKDTYSNLGYQVVFQDKGAVLIKVR